jgi:hypothetical protein
LPDLNTFPNTHYWYLFLGSFSPVVLKGWAEKHAPAPTTAAPVKEAAKDDDIDLFGDDEPAAPVEKPKPKPAAKPKKEKPIAKSIVVFDVKVYEVMTDAELDALAQKVLAL